MTERSVSPFNSALETGVRSLVILAASSPGRFDLGRLVQFDYLVVHSEDADGPPSLHPALPLRSGELLVRRGLVERGLNLMISRGLVSREPSENGFMYGAEDHVGSFLDALTTDYIRELAYRAEWVVATFAHLDTSELDRVTRRLFDKWTTEFQVLEAAQSNELAR